MNRKPGFNISNGLGFLITSNFKPTIRNRLNFKSPSSILFLCLRSKMFYRVLSPYGVKMQIGDKTVLTNRAPIIINRQITGAAGLGTCLESKIIPVYLYIFIDKYVH